MGKYKEFESIGALKENAFIISTLSRMAAIFCIFETN